MRGWPTASSRYAEYVAKVAHCGHWELTGKQTSDVVQIRRIGHRDTLAYGTHDGGNDYNAPRNFAAAAQRLCGCRFIEPRNRKRSRKAVVTSGFSVDAAKREQGAWHREYGANVERLHERRTELMRLCRIAADSQQREQILTIAPRLREIAEIEDRLADLHQPVERFDPHDLAQ